MRTRGPVALLLVLAVLGGCKQESESEPLRPVLSTKAVVRTTDTLGPYAGSIQPRYSTEYGFRLFGRIVARRVDVGDIVKAGDELAVLDPSVQALLVRNAEAAVVGAEAQLANAQAEELRQRPLVERNITPQAQFDIVVQNRDTAAANLARAQVSLARAQDTLSFTRLLADFDGVVTGRYAEAGQVVNAGQKVVTVARPQIREAVIAVPSLLASALTAGQKFDMEVVLDGSIRMKVAAVRGVDPAADTATRTHVVYLTLDNPPEAFRLGTTISVTMSRPVTPRIDLPSTALLEQDGKTQVWIVDPSGRVALREVKIVARDGNTISIGDGIRAGERVVTVGVHSLKAGQTVKIAPEPRT
jgi:RND family efflux transporter MFP subunit